MMWFEPRERVQVYARSETVGDAEHRAPRNGAVAALRARVLIIDDEAPVLRAYSRILAVDHQVTTVCGGAEAIALLDQDVCFDLILCDIMMPEIDGIAVHDHLRVHHPSWDASFVFCSGGIFSLHVQDRLAQLPIRLIEKPIAPSLLRQLAADCARRHASTLR